MFEFYRDDESFKRHYSDPAMDAGHQRVFDLIADGSDEWGVRESVHIVYCS